MKTITTLLLILIFSDFYSQEIAEKVIASEVNEVTVFHTGAQITRKIKVELNKGNTLVKFSKLSPFIDPKSVQVKAAGELTVLSVNHQQNYLNELQKSEELTSLEKELESIDEKMRLENTYLAIIAEELGFLKDNRDIGGINGMVSIDNLQKASDFFSSKLTALKLKEVERNKTLKHLNEQKNNIQNQINNLTTKKDYPSGEIWIKVEAKKTGTFPVEISYIVNNAGWFPSYDIRAININEPVQLIYKANVKQDTKEDWLNVKLKFSSSNPTISGLAPKLQTYFLNYNILPPNYKLTSNIIRGRVTDVHGGPLVGAYIIVEGTTIGTVTDADGNYSITIPDNSALLKFEYIGYLTEVLPVDNEIVNAVLAEDIVALNEIVVTGYGSRKKESVTGALQGKVSGINDSKVKIRGVSTLPVPITKVENQTAVNFEIGTPYTVKSDNKNYTVDMELYNLPAYYQYYCVPKINRDAYLIAHITDWEKYNLLEGEANVFFEDTYVGKTLLDVRYASDTLEISLGRDKMVSVDRVKIKDYTNRQFIGAKKEESRAWETTVKNNKNQLINMVIIDQVPVSTLEEIEVDLHDISGGKHNPENGEIRWEFDLRSSDMKEIDLKYSVKYPKNKYLVVE